MEEQLIFKTLSEYKTHIESLGYTVYAIMLKGSQNYNLDDDESDIDANVILIPKLHEMAKGITKKFAFNDGEVTAHDIYSFAKIVAKGNPQWIEVCHTKYKIGGSLEMFKGYRINPSALKGMAYEKVKAFDHLFPSREHMVKNFGYDPKQLHHIIRLYDLLKENVCLLEYGTDLRENMIAIKRGSLDVKTANIKKDEYMNKIIELTKERKLEYKQQKIDYDAINEIVYSYIKSEAKQKQANIVIRTFGGDIPKFIKQTLNEEELIQYKDKDLSISCFIEIEEL